MTLLIEMPIYFHLSSHTLKSLLWQITASQDVIILKGILSYLHALTWNELPTQSENWYTHTIPGCFQKNLALNVHKCLCAHEQAGREHHTIFK